MRDLHVEVRNMGTFQRVFFTCEDGHDMGSVPLDMLDGHRMDPDCHHYEHKRKVA